MIANEHACVCVSVLRGGSLSASCNAWEIVNLPQLPTRFPNGRLVPLLKSQVWTTLAVRIQRRRTSRSSEVVAGSGSMVSSAIAPAAARTRREGVLHSHAGCVVSVEDRSNVPAMLHLLQAQLWLSSTSCICSYFQAVVLLKGSRASGLESRKTLDGLCFPKSHRKSLYTCNRSICASYAGSSRRRL
eukprot:3213533-Amphidinium_carterae.1